MEKEQINNYKKYMSLLLVSQQIHCLNKNALENNLKES